MKSLKFVRRAGNITACAVVVLASLVSSGRVAAQTTTPELVHVEEDWVSLVGEPDSATSSPQILNVISPGQDQDGLFALVQINHRGAPDFVAGGQQLQAWIGPSLVGYGSGTKTAILNRNSDSVRYTISMEKVSNGIRFQLKNGRSRTWGRFATTPISVTVATPQNSLSAYSPDFSTSNTTVNLGAHRIAALYITATRMTYSDGQSVTDTTDRFTHRYQLSIEDVPVDIYEANPDEYEVDITEQ